MPVSLRVFCIGLLGCLSGAKRAVRAGGERYHRAAIRRRDSFRRCGGASDLEIDGRAGHTVNLGGRQSPSIAQHGRIEGAGETGEAEVFGHFVGEAVDEFRRLGPSVLDRVQRPAGDEIHFSLADAKLRVLVARGKYGDQGGAFEAVADFIRVGMPVRFAEATFAEGEAVTRPLRRGKFDWLIATFRPQALSIWGGVVRNEVRSDLKRKT